MARILVIDDEAIYCDLLSVILKRRGHDIRTASHGAEGITIAEQFNPHLMLVDWALAGEYNGVDVARRLLEKEPSLRIILITGHSATEVDPNDRHCFCGILEKPFGIAEVVDIVERTLRDSRAGFETPRT